MDGKERLAKTVFALMRSAATTTTPYLHPDGTFPEEVHFLVQSFADAVNDFDPDVDEKHEQRQLAFKHAQEHGLESVLEAHKKLDAIRGRLPPVEEAGTLLLRPDIILPDLSPAQHDYLRSYLNPHFRNVDAKRTRWGLSSMQTEQVNEKVDKLLDPLFYRPSTRREGFESKNAKYQFRVGDQKHKVTTKLYLTPGDKEYDVVIKHIHMGVSDAHRRDKADVVAALTPDGLLAPYHWEVDSSASRSITGKYLREESGQGGLYETIPSAQFETKTSTSDGVRWQNVQLGNLSAKVYESEFDKLANADVLLARPNLMGGIPFAVSAMVLQDNYDRLQDLAKRLKDHQ